MTLTFGSLFAGIGGFDAGLEAAGMACRWQVEKDEACQRVLARHWPNVPRHGDITEAKGADLGPADLICGGFPCQDLSVAGKRAGLAGKRSGLFHEFIRIVGEVAPRWVLIENVPGLLSSNRGRDMAIVVGEMGKLGYGWAYRILDAQYFGVAQRRRRVFLVGCLGDAARAAAVLFEPQSCDGDSPPRRQTGAGVAPSVTPGARRASGARSGEQLTTVYTELGEGHQTYQESQVASGLRTSAGGGGTKANIAVYQATGAGVFRAGSPSLSAGDDNNSNQVVITHTLKAEGHDASEDGTGRGVPLVPVAFQERGREGGRTLEFQADLAYSMMAPRGGGRRHENNINHGTTVRRLTPRECERLQGFSDDWTAGESDSSRYRMLGNAVCRNVAEWIGRRIVAAEGIA